MSADDLADFYVHTATVQTKTGTGSRGDIFAPASAPIPCFTDDSRKLVRDKDGQQIVSESTLYTYPANATLFTPGSKVTIGTGRTAIVIRVNVNDSGDLDLPDHVAVSLT